MTIMDRISRYWSFAKSAKEIVQYLVWLGSLIGMGGFVIYLGSITEWAKWLGPLGWVLIAICATFLVLTCSP